ncbi:MAG: ParA family protein [Deltaproteobacteria bacterium]|nr:ParA family protein [Deltaproteobacteria bacterium]
MSNKPVRFDEALDRALTFCRQHAGGLGGDVVVVRDVVGRIRIATTEPARDVDVLARGLHALLGAWSPGVAQLFLAKPDLLDPSAIFQAPELRRIEPRLGLVERWITETDWVRPATPPPPAEAPRLAFFGVKGGVGRSSALVAVARHLAEQGGRVVVVDLDLESPGVSASLLPPEGRPRFGVVDWFVEGGASQADEDLVGQLVTSSGMAAGTTGEIRVVSAAGERVDTYVTKLGRVQTASTAARGFAEQLDQLLRLLERRERPVALLLDCRAGIDDLAAAVVTRLSTTSLLFAVDTPQTWLAYRLLFSTWHRDRALLEPFRDGLRIVAGLVPETERQRYLDRLRNHAYDLFADYVYEEAAPEDIHSFNFDLDDETAPHRPIPVYWRRELQDWDPVGSPDTVTEEQIAAAFGELLSYVDDLLGREAEGPAP